MSPVASFHLVRYPASAVPVELVRFVTQRRHLRRTDGLRFAKILGSARGRTMSRSADLRRWALFAVWDDHEAARSFRASSPITDHWRRRAIEAFHVGLEPIRSRGSWNGLDPFGPLPDRSSGEAPVAVLTRATLRWRTMRDFYRAVPPVDDALVGRPDLLASVGVGEAPVGRQGTFSLWRSASAVDDFAYRHRAHRSVIGATRSGDWYREELFARFAVVEWSGCWDGVDPLAGAASPDRG